MSAHEKIPLAILACLALVVAGFVLLAKFDWPTSRIVQQGRSITERNILIYDVVPLVVVGYGIGLGAIAVTRFMFPKSHIKVSFCTTGAGVALVALPLLALSAAISGTPTLRDLGVIVALFAVPLAIATWAIVSWAIASWIRPK